MPHISFNPQYQNSISIDVLTAVSELGGSVPKPVSPTPRQAFSGHPVGAQVGGGDTSQTVIFLLNPQVHRAKRPLLRELRNFSMRVNFCGGAAPFCQGERKPFFVKYGIHVSQSPYFRQQGRTFPSAATDSSIRRRGRGVKPWTTDHTNARTPQTPGNADQSSISRYAHVTRSSR